MIQLHYCGQELESWNLFADNDGCMDDNCGDESTENDDCCKDELVVAKVNNEQNVAQQLVFKFIAADYNAIFPNHQFFQLASEVAAQQHTSTNTANAPPGLWQNIPLYKLNSNFTYYG